jgi:hypothetical protein
MAERERTGIIDAGGRALEECVDKGLLAAEAGKGGRSASFVRRGTSAAGQFRR